MEWDIESRKVDHIRVTLEANVEARSSTLLEDVWIVHNPLPEIDEDDIDLSVEFCGKRLRAPLMITAMTGGSDVATQINRELARAAEKHGIAIGVGSQRAGIEKPSLRYTYRVVREEAPTTLVVANLGAPQLSKGYGPREAREAVEMIDADVLAIHLNPGQEFFQVEGDPYYSNVIERIAEIVDAVDVPVLVKETGTGLSYEIVRILYKLGVRCFDVAGLGGTNWIKVEILRAQRRGDKYRPAGPLMDYWGVPTAVSIIEARKAAPGAYIVGSGGIRNGLDAAKAIALGADVAGAALHFLRSLLRGGPESLDRALETMKTQIKAVLFMTGARKPTDLWRVPIVLGHRVESWLKSRGINSREYIFWDRLEPLRVGR